MTHEEKKQDIRNQLSNLDAFAATLETAKAKIYGAVTVSQGIEREATYTENPRRYGEQHDQDTIELNGHVAAAGAALDNLQAVINHALDTINLMRTQTLEEAKRPPAPPTVPGAPPPPGALPPPSQPPPQVPTRVWERFGGRVPTLDEKETQLALDAPVIDTFITGIEGLKAATAALVDTIQSESSELFRGNDPRGYANALESAGYTMGANIDAIELNVNGLAEQLELIADMAQEIGRQATQAPGRRTLPGVIRTR